MRVTDELMETPGEILRLAFSTALVQFISFLCHAVHCTRAVECLTRRFFSDTLSESNDENTERCFQCSSTCHSCARRRTRVVLHYQTNAPAKSLTL